MLGLNCNFGCANFVAGVDLGESTLRRQHPTNIDDDVVSVASGFSAASATDGAGSLYEIQQHSPAALFMSPSASFGETDTSAGYEPTMSPGAFQAAMAAGILAAQGVPPSQPTPEDSNAQQPGHSSQLQLAGDADGQDSTVEPLAGPVDVQHRVFNEPNTPSSVASNSAVSLPVSQPGLSAAHESVTASTTGSAAFATPVSKPTQISSTTVTHDAAEEGAPDPASPSAGASTTAAGIDSGAVSHAHKASSPADNADSDEATDSSRPDISVTETQQPGSNRFASLHEAAVSPASVSPKAATSEPDSTRLAEVADASGQAEALSTASQSIKDNAQSVLAVSQSKRSADSQAASSVRHAPAAASKSLFATISKRPAEVSKTLQSTYECKITCSHPTAGRTCGSPVVLCASTSPQLAKLRFVTHNALPWLCMCTIKDGKFWLVQHA